MEVSAFDAIQDISVDIANRIIIVVCLFGCKYVSDIERDFFDFTAKDFKDFQNEAYIGCLVSRLLGRACSCRNSGIEGIFLC